jgi:hypothetical protein
MTYMKSRSSYGDGLALLGTSQVMQREQERGRKLNKQKKRWHIKLNAI